MFEIYVTELGAEIHCHIHIAKPTATIHVLDANAPDTMSVTNGIEQIQAEIMERHGLAGNIPDWNWILYGTDGIASLFRDGKFELAPENLLYQPFLNMSKNYLSDRLTDD